MQRAYLYPDLISIVGGIFLIVIFPQKIVFSGGVVSHLFRKCTYTLAEQHPAQVIGGELHLRIHSDFSYVRDHVMLLSVYAPTISSRNVSLPLGVTRSCVPFHWVFSFMHSFRSNKPSESGFA